MKSKKSKKTFSLSIGTIVIGLVIIVGIIILIMKMTGKIGNTTNKQDVYQSNNNLFSNSELKALEENNNYKREKKIQFKDLNIGEIYCGMKLSDMISVLGECNNIYESSLVKNLNYQTYRYDNYNLIIDIDKNTEIVKAISYAGNHFENKKGIKIGSTISEVTVMSSWYHTL